MEYSIPQGRQRYQCKTCGRTFTETKGTIFYRRRTLESEIIETLALVAEGVRVSGLARAKGHGGGSVNGHALSISAMTDRRAGTT